MCDRLVALGIGRPIRVRDGDYDVPMLTENDFEIVPLSDRITIITSDCTLIRDVEAQMQLAQMCIAKGKLCLCISHVLATQYSALREEQGVQGQQDNTRHSVILRPKLCRADEAKCYDEALSDWVTKLPDSCTYSSEISPGNSGSAVFVQRASLHMIYFAVLSALYTPQILPSAVPSQPAKHRKLHDLSRKTVREALTNISRIYQDLQSQGLEKHLPTTGVTVLLHATIIHLLDIKSGNDEARQAAMGGLNGCTLLLEMLHGKYVPTDFTSQLLEFTIRLADIDADVGILRNRRMPEDVQVILSSDKYTQLFAGFLAPLAARLHSLESKS
jgi:hypothetical protein